ncbi:MAG: hypothetical protein KZQ77_18345 [Candidatus Thiodiazotropha sp. (ex Notomyrtea botanica)]|nr:hypothetical protein [Candidatus Thiodiazotropha sp. (ex Notomyrtea botanica)]
MEVIPGIGTDKIRFGITENEAISCLGAPDKTYTTDGGSKRLQFNLLCIELSFEPENENRLGWIEIHNPEYLMGSRKLIGASQQEVLSFVTELLDEEPEIEDYGSFLSVSYDEHWVELQFQFGRLDCINVGVLYDESEKPQWPSS